MIFIAGASNGRLLIYGCRMTLTFIFASRKNNSEPCVTDTTSDVAG